LIFAVQIGSRREVLSDQLAIQAAEKLKYLSFRGTLRAEESLNLLNLKPGEIPRFARNDKIIYFFRSLYKVLHRPVELAGILGMWPTTFFQ